MSDPKINHDTAILAGISLIGGVVLCCLGHADVGATLISSVTLFAFTKPLYSRGD